MQRNAKKHLFTEKIAEEFGGNRQKTTIWDTVPDEDQYEHLYLLIFNHLLIKTAEGGLS